MLTRRNWYRMAADITQPEYRLSRKAVTNVISIVSNRQIGILILCIRECSAGTLLHNQNSK